MDEPFSAVDALTRQGLQDLLLQLWADLHLTILFVTHDIDEAIYVADEVLVLSAGPSRVISRMEIGLARPRDQLATRESSEFLAYRRKLYDLVVGRGASGRGGHDPPPGAPP